MSCSRKPLSLSAFCFLGLFLVNGCNEKPPAANPAAAGKQPPAVVNPPEPVTPEPAQAPAATITAPSGQLLYQPVFTWSNGEQSSQGTGFFVKAPNGKLAAVTSAHFIDPDSPALVKAQWQTIDGQKIAATLTKSWGPPGKLGGSKFDQRRDYLLFPAEPELEIPQVLEFDPRPRVEDEELIWFVDKDGSKSATEQRVVTGRVTLESPLAIVIQLDEPIELQSQSGSPFISQKTGKVIGILSLAGGEGDELKLYAAPVRKMLEQLQDDGSFPELRTVIGKAPPAARPE